MNGRQSAVVLGLLAALYAAALVLLAPKMDSFGEFGADAPLMLAAGLLFASPPVLAIWSVHGEARTVNRWLVPTWLFCAFFLAAGYGQVRNYGSGSAEILLLMAIGWLTAYVTLLLALRVLRAVRGWRLRMTEASTPGSHEKRRQFTIRSLLVWTTATAALCAGFRWLAAYGGFEITEEPSADMLFAVLIQGTIMGLLVALSGLPVVGVAWIVLPDGQRPYLRWTVAAVTPLGIAAGAVVFGYWISDAMDIDGVALILMMEAGVLAVGLAAACVLRACGYHLCRQSRSTPSMADAAAPATVRVGNRRFASTLATFGVAAALLAAYAPLRFETWRRADETKVWLAWGWNASFDDEGQVAGLRYQPDHDLAGSEHLLANLHSLRSLDFTHSQLTDAQLQQYLIHCPAMAQLESLDLTSTKVTDLGLSRLEALVALKDLDVSDTSVSFSRVPSLPRLESLTLDGTAAGDSDLVNLAAFANLKTLRLIGTNVTDAGLANLRALPALSWLDLSVTDVTDDAVASLAPLTQLRHVNLELTAVSEAGLVALNKALPEADIGVGADDALLDRVFSGRPNVIHQGGSLAYMTGAISCSPQTLKRLHARGNYPAGYRAGSIVAVNPKTVTDAGLKSLAGLTAMEELDLRESGVTDAGLGALAKLTNLQHLDLRGTAVTDAGRASLAKSLPGCTILR